MKGATPPRALRLLVYEPRVEGHHPGWLRFLVEDFLGAGCQLTLAVDTRPQSRSILEEHLGDHLKAVRLMPAVDALGRPVGGSALRAVAGCLGESGADVAFLGAFDEVASTLLRRTALGLPLPADLHGRVGGIYHRPRFTQASRWSFNRLLKTVGFRKLMRSRWARPLLVLDPYLAHQWQTDYPRGHVHYLPDPVPEGFEGGTEEARAALGLDPRRPVFLFFGVGSRRKGLRFAVDAFLRLGDPDPILLVAGRQAPSGAVRRGLERLVGAGQALVLDRYVSAAEEKLCFRSADVVLLPYLGHFGSSGVLSRAVAARKPVIASGEQLLGRLVGDHRLGLLFAPGSAGQLTERIREASRFTAAEWSSYRENAARWAQACSRGAFREALVGSVTRSSPVE